MPEFHIVRDPDGTRKSLEVLTKTEVRLIVSVDDKWTAEEVNTLGMVFEDRVRGSMSRLQTNLRKLNENKDIRIRVEFPDIEEDYG